MVKSGYSASMVWRFQKLTRPRGISPGPLMLPLTVRLVGAITGRLGLVEARVPYLIDLTVLRR